jgi:hypothetical protein
MTWRFWWVRLLAAWRAVRAWWRRPRGTLPQRAQLPEAGAMLGPYITRAQLAGYVRRHRHALRRRRRAGFWVWPFTPSWHRR